MKITNNKFLKNTIILIFSGFMTKILGLIIKILFTRISGDKTISLYTLVMPTYSLILTICTFAMPSTISKLTSNNKDPYLLNTASIFIIILNFIIMFLMFLISPFIANKLLHNKDSVYLLYAMSITLPFSSIACILKGYFYGKQKMFPHVISNTIEQIIRLLIVIFIMPKVVKKSYILAACTLILTFFITELASIITFLLFMKKEDIINLKKIKFSVKSFNNIISISLPSVSSKIIGNISYFFEPIIITNMLLLNGYSKEYILLEYGAYNAYCISTLTIPSFFIAAICNALIPEISKNQDNPKQQYKTIRHAFIFSFIIGISFTSIIFIFRKELLLFLYNTSLGLDYIKYLAPFFILFYFEAIFISFNEAIGNTKLNLKITLITSFIKNICLLILSNFKIGMYSLLISEIINIILVVVIHYINFRKYIKRKH